MKIKHLVVLLLLASSIIASGQDKVMICVSATAHAYHNSYCQGMRACTHKVDKISMKEAKELGKDPCSIIIRVPPVPFDANHRQVASVAP